MGIPNPTILYWVATSFLFPALPGVYAVGHPGRSAEADLLAAVLYAGPDAGLNGLTAALWRGFVKWRTADAIEVATPRRCRSLPADHPRNTLNRAVDVRSHQTFRRWMYKGIPTVPPAQIVLDLAAGGDLQLVRFALANMDFMRILNERALLDLCGRGLRGSALLRAAIDRPQPLFARVRSPFEVDLIGVCETTGIRPPDDVNVKIANHPVDAVWWDEQVVVECDGEGNHGTWRQQRRDRSQDRALRTLHFLPIRYSRDDLRDPEAVRADLGAQLEARRGRGGQPLAA